MNEEGIAKFFTDESVLKFVDGSEIKGAKEVSDTVMEFCESYNAGYMDGFGKVVVKGGLAVIAGGLITYGVVRAAKKIIKSRRLPVELNLNQNKEMEGEAE